MDKIAFQFGSFPIHWYGLLLALGFIAGIWTASRRAMRDRIAPENVVDAGAWLIIGAIIGARALYVVSYWDVVFKDPLFPKAPWTEVLSMRRVIGPPRGRQAARQA